MNTPDDLETSVFWYNIYFFFGDYNTRVVDKLSSNLYT